MRKLLCVLLLLAAAASGWAKTPKAKPDLTSWSAVRYLEPGSKIQVQTATKRTRCSLTGVDAESVTCIHRGTVTFRRGEVLSVRVTRSAKSVLFGAAIWGGVGAAAAVVSAGSQNEFAPPSQQVNLGYAAAIGGGALAAVSVVVETRPRTVYRAP